MKLFKVTCHYASDCYSECVCFVLAGNDIEARRVAEEENSKSVYIHKVEEVDMEFPQLLCCIDKFWM